VRLVAEPPELDDLARVVDALAREVDALARVLDDFARELDDPDPALALRVDPLLRLAGALRARGNVFSYPAIGRRRDYLTRAVPAAGPSNTIRG
jgi:hypothetical protein